MLVGVNNNGTVNKLQWVDSQGTTKFLFVHGVALSPREFDTHIVEK